MRGTKKIDWLNHFLEFIVVVIGILLAFQLNTCREAKKEDNLVESHVKNVVEETQFNKQQIEGSLETSKTLLQKLDTLINLTAQKELDRNSAHILSMELMSLDYMYLKKNAYNSLVETGDIRFMDNSQLQKDIISLYEYYTWLEGLDTSTRTSYLENYLPYATKNFDLIHYQAQAAEVYTNKLFRNYLSVYRYSLRYRQQKQEDLLAIVDEFLIKYTP
ncbi:hypothetical protein [Marinirhabdus gelatinilytica]|uniref:Uncharacterized protein n=1 Tax=Marinirhabdus gelatinilytica TaxID=1703343 RepID=A0A370QJ04_9FLAO|nr:hypothetical protein [Marinirhabdus gelatinilytica]RDK88336.1 hypothetical protein C8D94_101207 [Marinirhabdus gelatinilytica]